MTIHSFKSGSFIGSKLRPSIPVAFIQEEDDFNTEELNDQLGLQQSSTYKSSHGNSNKSISGSDSEWSRSRSGSEMDTISTNGIGKKTSQSPLLDVPRDVGGKRTRERFQKPGSVE